MPPKPLRPSGLLTLALVVTGCTADEASIGPPPDAGVVSADAGSAPADAGLIAPDAGPGPRDAGEVVDAGHTDAGESITFTGDVWPVFEASGCDRVECHGSILFQGGLTLMLPDPSTSLREFERDAFVSGRPLVVPGEPDQSELFLHGRDANLPAGDLSSEGLGVIRAWIEAGAAPGPVLKLPDPETPTTCDVAGGRWFPAIPEACSPSCTAATRDAVVECRQDANPVACQDATTDLDPTPPLALQAGTESTEVDCGACLDWQTWACGFEFCAEELEDVFRCQFGVPLPTCASANATASACLADSGYDACRRDAVERCFASP